MILIISGYDAIGDWISYNGMIRYLSTIYDKIYLHTHNKIVSMIFSDNKKIQIGIPNNLKKLDNHIDQLALTIWEKHNKMYNYIKNYFDKDNKIGIFHNIEHPKMINPPKSNRGRILVHKEYENNSTAFYLANGISKNIKFDNFYIKRDTKAEDKLFNKLNLKSNQYIVICEYGKHIINKKYIDNNYKIINLHKISNFIDIFKVVEEAKEIHLIENSIALMIYHMQYNKLMKNNHINFHLYARKERHRHVSNKNNHNQYTDMFLFPKLENWTLIYN